MDSTLVLHAQMWLNVQMTCYLLANSTNHNESNSCAYLEPARQWRCCKRHSRQTSHQLDTWGDSGTRCRQAGFGPLKIAGRTNDTSCMNFQLHNNRTSVSKRPLSCITTSKSADKTPQSNPTVFGQFVTYKSFTKQTELLQVLNQKLLVLTKIKQHMNCISNTTW